LRLDYPDAGTVSRAIREYWRGDFTRDLSVNGNIGIRGRTDWKKISKCPVIATSIFEDEVLGLVTSGHSIPQVL